MSPFRGERVFRRSAAHSPLRSRTTAFSRGYTLSPLTRLTHSENLAQKTRSNILACGPSPRLLGKAGNSELETVPHPEAEEAHGAGGRDGCGHLSEVDVRGVGVRVAERGVVEHVLNIESSL